MMWMYGSKWIKVVMNEQRQAYTSDLTDEEWVHLRTLLPGTRGKGNRRSSQQQRELINAMNYVIRTGCQWRDLPHDFPNWKTVYSYYRDLKYAGVWQAINTILRRGVREQAGRNPDPSVVIVDSQSVKTTEKRGTVVDSMAANE
jgi:putative transposase